MMEFEWGEMYYMRRRLAVMTAIAVAATLLALTAALSLYTVNVGRVPETEPVCTASRG